MRYFITGIGTGIGKTLAAAALVKKLEADYWKPVQSGDLEASDSLAIQQLAAHPHLNIHPEAYRLKQPLSPHQAAALDGVTIELGKINLPVTERPLIIEGAGGLMVPLNEQDLMLDLIEKLGAEVILVSRHYLGSINHTLLSAMAMKQRGLKVKGILFNGNENLATESIILKHTGLPILGRLPDGNEINSEFVTHCASCIQL